MQLLGRCLDEIEAQHQPLLVIFSPLQKNNFHVKNAENSNITDTFPYSFVTVFHFPNMHA